MFFFITCYCHRHCTVDVRMDARGAILSSPQSRIIIERVNTSSVLTIRTPTKMITFFLLLIEGSARAQYLR